MEQKRSKGERKEQRRKAGGIEGLHRCQLQRGEEKEERNAWGQGLGQAVVGVREERDEKEQNEH